MFVPDIAPGRGLRCALHHSHAPVPEVFHDHHIRPQSWGGSSAKANRVVLCPTGHYDVHAYLDLLVKFGGKVPWSKRRHFGPATRRLAERGYDETPAERRHRTL